MTSICDIEDFKIFKNVPLACRRSALLAGDRIEESCDPPRNIISRRLLALFGTDCGGCWGTGDVGGITPAVVFNAADRQN